MREILAIHVVGEFAIMLKVEIPREVSGRKKKKTKAIQFLRGTPIATDSDNMGETN